MSAGDTSASTRPSRVLHRLAAILGALAGVGTLASISTLVVRRIVAGGVQPYGCDGAPYIEHVARLRVLQVVREGTWFAPWKMLVDADGAFPPGMHLMTLSVGAIFGHGTEVALLTGPFWLVVLALSVGAVAALVAQGRGRGAGDGAGGWAGLAALCVVPLFPAVHGFATRYYYDLPMTALIWLSVATFLAIRPRSLWVAGLSSGGVLAMASLVKWSALPFGLVILVGAACCGRSNDDADDGVLAPVAETTRRGVALALACAVAGGLSWLFLRASGESNSYRQMSWETFEGVAPGPGLPPSLEAVLPDFLNAIASQTVAGWFRLAMDDLAFYPARLVVSALSPPLAIVCLLAVLFWGARDRRGMALVGSIALGHGALLVLVIPRLDDRFLLPGLPVLAIVMGCAWSRAHAAVRWVVLPAVVALGLGVAWDFHEGAPSTWTEPMDVLEGRGDIRPPTVARGWGATSSVQRLGWVRHDEEGSARTSFREVLWEALSRCRESRIGELDGRPALGGCGNRFWWEYRGDLGRLQGGDGRLPFVSGYVWQSPAEGGGTATAPEVLLVGQEGEGGWLLPSGLEDGAWTLHSQLDDPEGGPGAALWIKHGLEICAAQAETSP